MTSNFRVAVVGGGLAGLTASIHLSLLGYNVILFEKNKYPSHKVCGEYISNEVKPYLQSLGMGHIFKLSKDINHFQFSTINGTNLTSKLEKGGFGISRFALDELLYVRAKQFGVQFYQMKVLHITSKNEEFEILTESKVFKADYCLGAFGKRSILDKKLKRSFTNTRTPWLAVKAHYEADLPDNLVGLHHFDGGYCGISKIETGLVNVCYLIHQREFEKHKDFQLIEENVLYKNPSLRSFFRKAKLKFEKPLTISQIYFGNRSKSENEILMIGDAGGMIHPLAGNGMAIAFHSAKIAVEHIDAHDKNSNESLFYLSKKYTKAWNSNFKSRILKGSLIQFVLEKIWLSKICMVFLQRTQFLLPWIIRQTHGKDIEAVSFSKNIYKKTKNAI